MSIQMVVGTYGWCVCVVNNGFHLIVSTVDFYHLMLGIVQTIWSQNVQLVCLSVCLSIFHSDVV